MEISVLRIPEGIPQWHLVVSFLRLRKEVFIDKMDWQLHDVEAMEYEQYDRFDAVYIIAHENGKVLGGARLLRSDRTMGVYSYMLRDAFRGLLPGIPQEVCDVHPPSSDTVWELTRLAVNRTGDVARRILEETNKYLSSQGASECLFLGPPSFMRMAKSMLFQPKPLGKISGNRDGRFLAFSCAIR